MSELIVHINPLGKPRMTQRDRWAKRPCVTRYFEYKDALVKAAEEQGFELGRQFAIEIFIQMPKSWSAKRRKEMALKLHDAKPDIDNLLKGVMDCLLKEDSSVSRVMAAKYWAHEGMIYIRNFNSNTPSEGASFIA